MQATMSTDAVASEVESARGGLRLFNLVVGLISG
jgi:hypothetical protein